MEQVCLNDVIIAWHVQDENGPLPVAINRNVGGLPSGMHGPRLGPRVSTIANMHDRDDSLS
jgi:hypothetical protein